MGQGRSCRRPLRPWTVVARPKIQDRRVTGWELARRNFRDCAGRSHRNADRWIRGLPSTRWSGPLRIPRRCGKPPARERWRGGVGRRAASHLRGRCRGRWPAIGAGLRCGRVRSGRIRRTVLPQPPEPGGRRIRPGRGCVNRARRIRQNARARCRPRQRPRAKCRRLPVRRGPRLCGTSPRCAAAGRTSGSHPRPRRRQKDRSPSSRGRPRA